MKVTEVPAFTIEEHLELAEQYLGQVEKKPASALTKYDEMNIALAQTHSQVAMLKFWTQRTQVVRTEVK